MNKVRKEEGLLNTQVAEKKLVAGTLVEKAFFPDGAYNHTIISTRDKVFRTLDIFLSKGDNRKGFLKILGVFDFLNGKRKNHLQKEIEIAKYWEEVVRPLYENYRGKEKKISVISEEVDKQLEDYFRADKHNISYLLQNIRSFVSGHESVMQDGLMMSAENGSLENSSDRANDVIKEYSAVLLELYMLLNGDGQMSVKMKIGSNK